MVERVPDSVAESGEHPAPCAFHVAGLLFRSDELVQLEMTPADPGRDLEIRSAACARNGHLIGFEVPVHDDQRRLDDVVVGATDA